jgi:hypothetical protein
MAGDTVTVGAATAIAAMETGAATGIAEWVDTDIVAATERVRRTVEHAAMPVAWVAAMQAE